MRPPPLARGHAPPPPAPTLSERAAITALGSPRSAVARRATAALLAAITALTPPSVTPAFEFVPLEDRPAAPTVQAGADGGVSVRFKASADPALAAAQRALVEAWAQASQHYVDEDAIHAPAWRAELGAALDASMRAGTVDATAAAADAMLASLGDQYTRLLRPGSEADAYVAGAEGEGVAVGLQLRASAGAAPTVAAVVPGSPAAAAHIVPGDTLLSVDGRPTAGRPVDDVARALTRTVRVEVARAGGRARALTLAAAPVQLHAVQFAALTPADAAAAAPVAYVRVAAFNRLAPGDVAAAVDRLFTASPPPRALILDLRDNAGGAVDAGIDVLTQGLLPSGQDAPFGSLTARGATEAVSLRGAARLPPPTALAVLVNGGTASTAELVAGALRGDGGAGHPHARLVGERTYGKGRTQRALPLSDGALLLVSNLRYIAPDGAPVDGVGLAPDVACAPGRVEPSFFVAGGDRGGGDLAAGLLQDPCVRLAAAELGTPLAQG